MISRELLKEVLLEQQARINRMKSQDFILREKLSGVKKFIELKHSIVITGVRRCGKSVFLSEIMNNFYEKFYYVNFEDERLASFELGDFNMLYEVCLELFGKCKVFSLDEVQNVDGWERWVRRKYEDNFKFFITGSNARLLSKELATSLTGRHLQFSIYPFSFREFLDFKKFVFKKEDLYLIERRVLLVKYFSEYLKKGGFPEFLKYEQKEILQGYFNDIIQRDIVERHNIKNVKQLKEFARYLITNSGNLVSYNKLKKIGEIKSVNTVIKYFSYLEDAYLLFSLPYFSYSLKKQTANQFKIYAIDNGLKEAISFKFSEDLGKLYENMVAIELKRRNKEFYYWKNIQHEEVDFVIKEKKVDELIQVCYSTEDTNTKNRELKALLKASKELKCNKLLVITSDYEGEEKSGNKKIRFVPLWKWILI